MSIIINLEHNILLSQGNHGDMQHHSWKLAGHPEKDIPCFRKQNHQMFLPVLVREACFGVCASRAGLEHQQTKQLPLTFPFPPPSSLLQGHLRGVFLHHHPCHHLPISYCTTANCLRSGTGNCSWYVKEAEAHAAWAPGGSEKAGGHVCPFPWERPHHPHPWCPQGLAVRCQVLMLWSYLGLMRSSLLPYFLFLLSFPYFGQGVAAICETRWSPFSSKRNYQEHWLVGVFLVYLCHNLFLESNYFAVFCQYTT